MQFFTGQHGGECRYSQQGTCWAVPARGPGVEGQRRAARGKGCAAGVWQVVVNRAGVVWKPKDGALGDWNEEQNVKEGLKGKNVVTEKKEVIGEERGHRRRRRNEVIGDTRESKFCRMWEPFDR